MRRRDFLSIAGMTLLGAWAAPGRAAQGPASKAPPGEKHDAPAPLRFAVIGDTGTGDKFQLAVAKQMVAEYERSPFALVLMLGDNNYRGNFGKQVKAVFETPYEKLLAQGVRFYATLGNHDQADAAEQMAYPNFNMGGKLHYTFSPAGDLAEFFTFDSTKIVEAADTSQLDWLEKALGESKARWKIVYFHHPPFSPGKRHGDNPILDERLVPILEKGGANVVLTGHEHFFARMREQNGVNYIISGSGGKIHTGGILPDPRMVAGNDAIHQFLSVALTPDLFSFSVIGENGATIYSESIPYAKAAAAGAAR